MTDLATRYGFRFDASACAGCKACQIACKDKHGLEVGRLWRRVYEVTGGGWRRSGNAWVSDVFAFHLSIACNHCDRPICVEVCPSRALGQRDDGIVLLDTDRCLGCSYCEWACPYGAPQFDAAAGVLTKCDLCRDHLEEGRDPACVEACMLRVLSVADLAGGRDGEDAVFPLPPADLTKPTTALTPHRDVSRAERSRPVLGNEEEIR